MKRVLLKISGEALSWDNWFWVSADSLWIVANKIKDLTEEWIQVSIVVWAWNYIRWKEVVKAWIDRATWDSMWMLAITMNGIAIKWALENIWINAFLTWAFEIPGICTRFNKWENISILNSGAVLICVGWTWNPYFTTDTVCVLRALELECDTVIKATQVDGLYDKDPNKYDDAKFIKEATFSECLDKWYQVMDLTAFSLAKENNMSIKIVSFAKEGAIIMAINEEAEWTTIKN